MSQESVAASELTAVFARMSGMLLTEETVQTALDLVVSLARQTIPRSVGAGVSLIHDDRRTTAAASDSIVEQADTLQYELDEGPCLTAYRTSEVVLVDDVATDPRWPRWAAAVAPLGLRSTLSAPMVAREAANGAIKVYSDQHAAFGERDQTLLTQFSAQAAILVANVQSYEAAQQLSDQLRNALANRDLISQAKGIIRAQQGIDDQEAFNALVKLSQQTDMKLDEVARQLADTVTPPPT